MFDDFRNAVNEESNEDESGNSSVAPFSFPDETGQMGESAEARPRRALRRLKVPREVLGMTPFQNFILSFLLLLMVVICGSFLLLITGRIALF